MRLVQPIRPALLLACLTTVVVMVAPAWPALAGPGGETGRDPASNRRWEWPLRPQPQVVALFDEPLGPYAAGHRGIDLAGTVGQPVLAVAAGEVTVAGPVAGRGVVVVDHGRLRTTYEPVRPLVRPGAVVAAGEVLGTLAMFGSHCLPSACLHLGVRDGADYLDPLDFLTTGPIRLLPVVPFGASDRLAPTVPPLVTRGHSPPLVARGSSPPLIARVLPPALPRPLMPPLATGFRPLLR